MFIISQNSLHQGLLYRGLSAMLQHENTLAKKGKKSLVQYHFEIHFLLPYLPTRSVTFTIHQSKSVHRD